MKAGWLTGVLLIGLLSLTALGADHPLIHIENIHTEITLRADGSLAVTESISIAGTNLPEAFLRVIPLRSTKDVDPRGFMRCRLESVTDRYDEKPGYDLYTSWDRAEIRVYTSHLKDSPPTVTLKYVISEAAARGRNEDILYWPLIGFGGDVTVGRVTAVVRMPTGVPVERTWFGVEDLERGAWRFHRPGEGPAWVESLRPLRAGEGFTVTVRFPPGHVAHPSFLFLAGRYALRAHLLVLQFWYYLLPFGFLLIWVLVWLFCGRDVLRGVPPVLPADGPPREVRAAEAGVIADNELNPRDSAAAVLDLANQGYLRIQVTGNRTPLFTLTSVEQSGGDLRPFERTLLEALFRNQRTSLPLTGLGRRFGAALLRVEDRVMTGLAGQGFFRRSPRQTLSTANAAAGISISILVLTGISLSLRFLPGPRWIYWSISIPTIFLILILAGRMPARTLLGLEVRARLLGFRSRLLHRPEEIQAHTSERSFYVAFPYAVALGVAENLVLSGAPARLRKPDWLEVPDDRWRPDLLLDLAGTLERELGRPGPAGGRRGFTWVAIPRYLWRP